MEKKNLQRKVDDRTILDNFCEDICKIVDKYAKYIVCSGFVSIAHGRSRGTEDIDMIIEKIPIEKFLAMHSEMVKSGFICMQSDDANVIYNDYLSNGISIRYVINEKGYFPPEMEIKFAKDELDKEQIKERVKFELTGLDVYFSSIESNIAFKEELLKSDKDMEDARHLRIIYEGKYNEDKINKIKEKIKKLRMKED
ncbi:MAG: hypothetical protein ACP5OG_04540 [Candidatus Nanoarchaeia archaeon]